MTDNKRKRSSEYFRLWRLSRDEKSTEEQRIKRLREKNERERMRRAAKKESMTTDQIESERKRRREYMREYNKRARLNESSEKREKRLMYERERGRKRRENATEKQKQRIRERDRARSIQRKTAKTSEQRKRDAEWKRMRRRTCLHVRIASNYRGRIVFALKNSLKAANTAKLLGIPLSEYKTYLESKFAPGMSWDNYGRSGWHIDHIRPCASFDLTDPEQQRQCFHYTNTQPLWASENTSKGDKWPLQETT